MDYSSPDYWNTRYRQQESTTFDWLEGYSTLRPHILNALGLSDSTAKQVAPSIKVLNIGCGNSSLPAEMYDTDGFTQVTSVDYSAQCIVSQVKRNQQKRPEL